MNLPTVHASSREFGRSSRGAAALYTLSVKGGIEVSITNYGGAVQSLLVPDAAGNRVDVVLGYDDLSGYERGSSFFGALIGRYANRIDKGRFMLEGEIHLLPINNGPNHLHGGPEGFHRMFWEHRLETIDGAPAVVLSLLSPDGDEGYPGALEATVIYQISNGTDLSIRYRARCSRPTAVNLTNHSYFNLSGDPRAPILDHELFIRAAQFTPTRDDLIPTGAVRNVAGTPFDFTTLETIGSRIEADDDQLRFAGGYDQNFVLARTGATEKLAAILYHPGSGRRMEVFTDQPGIQFYSGNFLDGTESGKAGVAYQYRTGLCLETQHFPDSPNQPDFPTTILVPGKLYETSTTWRFGNGRPSAPA